MIQVGDVVTRITVEIWKSSIQPIDPHLHLFSRQIHQFKYHYSRDGKETGECTDTAEGYGYDDQPDLPVGNYTYEDYLMQRCIYDKTFQNT